MADPIADREYDIVIVGGGPAGLTAALYAGRNKVRAALVEARGAVVDGSLIGAGGQLLNTELIEDYPGVRSILGPDLAEIMSEQAKQFGTELIGATVQSIRVEPDGTKVVETDQGNLRAPAVIITAGGNPRKLGVPGEAEFAGQGVSYCAVCDGAFFQGAHLAVVGGGDAAVEEAIFLTRFASRVTLIHRRAEFRAQPILIEEAQSHPKIDFILDTVVEAIEGEGKAQRLRLRNVGSGEVSTLEVGGVFIFIGFLPNTGLVSEHLEHDAGGYYLTDPMTMETSAPGIFAAGDVRSQLTRQVTTAVGDATTATIAATKWVEERARHAGAGSEGAVEALAQASE
ncbi:MAG TPA: FAD-dependent oxidoreductase [Candidatus Binatia bacterium]|nr:FAD-dependent oxidoreductase [Candidatus Binatia bacterium]